MGQDGGACIRCNGFGHSHVWRLERLPRGNIGYVSTWRLNAFVVLGVPPLRRARVQTYHRTATVVSQGRGLRNLVTNRGLDCSGHIKVRSVDLWRPQSSDVVPS